MAKRKTTRGEVLECDECGHCTPVDQDASHSCIAYLKSRIEKIEQWIEREADYQREQKELL